MGNLSALSSITTTATALSNLILATPQQTVGYQPNNPPNSNGTPSTAQPPPTFMFHYEGEQTAQMQSDITDHYIEDNTALQDQIALKPPEITTHGFIGELNNVLPPALAALQQVADKLTIVSAYTPALSASALIAFNTAVQLYQTAQNATNAAVSAWASINGTGSDGVSVITGQGTFDPAFNAQPNQNKQQLAFQQLYGYWNLRTFFTIQTPWAIFENMVIKSLRSIQSEETTMISAFEITFKQLRFATTIVSNGTVGSNQQGRSALQSANTTNLGTSTTTLAMSLSSGLSSSYGVG
jgi:hypothetical protein